MLQQRFINGSTSIRKQQTAVKQTIERVKTKSWTNPIHSYRSHPYSISQTICDDHDWFKSSRQIFDETPELELLCQEENLSEAQLKHFPSQAYDPLAPLPTPSVRKRTTVMKKISPQETEILRDADEDFVPSESDDEDDDDDDENYLPEHDRRPYHRNNHVNGTASRGRGRGGRTHLTTNTTTRLAPSTHFVRPSPSLNPHTRSQSSYSTSNSRHRPHDSFALELERTFANSLTRFYGTRAGQTVTSNDYRDFRIKCSICGEQSSNNISFVAHLCSHFEDDLNYVSPFDKHFRRCSFCPEDFSTPFQTFLHQDQRHLIDSAEFLCRICQENFSSLVDLFAHLNDIHPSIDMPYHCDRCFYRTSMYEDMAHHIRQSHQGSQYFFCPYCFQSVLLPSIPYTNLLNSTPAYRHVVQHFDRIENFNKQQRRIESTFKYCPRCVLHVKSLNEHQQIHHSKTDETTKRNLFRTDFAVYPSKHLPMATIRRRSTMNSPYEQVYENNRWSSRR